MPNSVKAKRLSIIRSEEKEPGGEKKFTLQYVSDDTKQKYIEVTRQVASRIHTQHLARNHTDNFNLYLNVDGVVEDFDSEPKNSNLPFDTTTTPNLEPAEKFLILEKTRAGTLNVKRNNGLPSDVVVNIKQATAKHLKDEGDIKAYDLIEDTYYVFDVRQDGRLVYIRVD